MELWHFIRKVDKKTKLKTTWPWTSIGEVCILLTEGVVNRLKKHGFTPTLLKYFCSLVKILFLKKIDICFTPYTHFKCTIQTFLVALLSGANIMVNQFYNIFFPPIRSLIIIYSTPLLSPPAPRKPLIFLSLQMSFLDISYKLNYKIRSLLCLASFT